MKPKILILFVLLISACASRTVKVLDASWASMKHLSPPTDVKKLVNTGQIEEEYCLKNWTGSYGLMDEAVKQAESKHKIDYIRNVSFMKSVSQPCVTVSGEGFRIPN